MFGGVRFRIKPRRDSQNESDSGTELSPRWESAAVTRQREGVWRRVKIGGEERGEKEEEDYEEGEEEKVMEKKRNSKEGK